MDVDRQSGKQTQADKHDKQTDRHRLESIDRSDGGQVRYIGHRQTDIMTGQTDRYRLDRMDNRQTNIYINRIYRQTDMLK